MNRILGLDLGSKTVGVALSDPLGLTAQGITTIKYEENDYNKALVEVLQYINQYKVKRIVLGYPKNMNGSIGERAEICENFKEMIQNEIDVDVILWDERLTTMQVNKILISADMSRKKRKKVVDKMAATIILQSYLDANI